jgi:hypothetical protein
VGKVKVAMIIPQSPVFPILMDAGRAHCKWLTTERLFPDSDKKTLRSVLFFAGKFSKVDHGMSSVRSHVKSGLWLAKAGDRFRASTEGWKCFTGLALPAFRG